MDIHQRLNWNYNMEKMINRGWKAYYKLEINNKLVDLWLWDKKNLLFETLVTLVILYGCEVWECNISRVSWRNTEQIEKDFITCNIKINVNTPYPILIIEASLSPIDNIAMIR